MRAAAGDEAAIPRVVLWADWVAGARRGAWRRPVRGVASGLSMEAALREERGEGLEIRDALGLFDVDENMQGLLDGLGVSLAADQLGLAAQRRAAAEASAWPDRGYVARGHGWT